MSDPLSAAGTAVGIISLGLQVCKTLVSYCKDWRAYDEDIQRIATEANEVWLSLQQLRYFIEDPHLDDPEILKDLERKAFGLKKTVVKLRETIKRLKPVLSDSVSDRIRAQAKKASYPFRKDTLREIANDLEGMQISLQTTLSMFVYRVKGEDILLIEGTNQKLDRYSARKTTEISIVSETILGKVDEMHLILSQYSLKNPPPPGLLRSCCDCQRELNQSMTRNRSSYRAKPPARVYKYYSHLLGVAFTASFWRPTGAGGFSIASPLDLKTIPVLDVKEWALDFQREIIRRSTEDTDSFLMWLRQEFAKRDWARAYDVHRGGSQTSSMVDYFYCPGHNSGPLLRFLLNLGSVPSSTEGTGVIGAMLTQPDFGEAEYLLISDLVERGGPIQVYRFDCNFKNNIQFILARNEEMVGYREITKIILRESESELRHALESKKSLGHDTFFEEYLLLNLAFGWPRGVQMLLDWGMTPDELWGFLIQDDLAKISADLSIFNGYYESAQILIKAGWQWNLPTPCRLLSCRSKKLRSLFINDLVVQRKTLWRQAEQFFPTDEFPSLEEGSVVDSNASCIYEALVAQGRKIDSRLGPGPMGTSVYHGWYHNYSVEMLEELYQAGFRDIDSCDSQGLTPLMFQLQTEMPCEKFAWFVSKGADPFHRLPRSSATATHLFSLNLAENWIIKRYTSLHDIDQVLRYCGPFLLSPIKDECVCACSPGGCSILAVALKHALLSLYPKSTGSWGEHLRELLQPLIYLHKSTSDFEKSIIRFFTFDALGVKHTCCIGEDYDAIFLPSPDQLRTRDWKEVEDILEEEQLRLKFLEKLVSEFEAKHAELDIPILEFLEKHWHPRMIEFLSQRDPYDEEHHEECKRLGIYLEAEEDGIFNRVSLSIGPRLVEVEDQIPE